MGKQVLLNVQTLVKNHQLLTMEIKIKQITYYNQETFYSILKVNVLKNQSETAIPNTIVVKGNFTAPYVGDVYQVTGVFQIDKRFGPFLNVGHQVQIQIPGLKEPLAQFIQRHTPGVGKVLSHKIVDTLGLDALSIINQDYHVLHEKVGISLKRAEAIASALNMQSGFEDLMGFLQNLQADVSLALPLYKKYGNQAVKLLRKNPYLIMQLDLEYFLDADRLAKKLQLPPDLDARFQAAILYALKVAEHQGNLALYYRTLKRELITGNFLNHHSAYLYQGNSINGLSEERFQKLYQQLLQAQTIARDFSTDQTEYVYLAYNKAISDSIVQQITNMLTHPFPEYLAPAKIATFLTQYEQQQGTTLAQRQKEAVAMVLNNRISILTGGPGTGKTTVLKAIVQVITTNDPQATIKFLAPTGKAAKRMSEITQKPASTIHSALGIQGFGRKNKLHQLNSDFVLVDESSMIDAALFNLLIKQLSAHTHLLLIGDYHQLPSVGAGLVLRDLIQSRAIPTVKLTEIFRQAENSILVTNDYAILQGLGTQEEHGTVFTTDLQAANVFLPTSQTADINPLILQCLQQLLTDFKLADIMILSSKYSGEIGVDNQNLLLQNTFNAVQTDNAVYRFSNGREFRVHDKVLQTVNNAHLGVTNGETGYIYSIEQVPDRYQRQHWQIGVHYPFLGNILYSGAEIGQLTLGYSMTVYKAQGSEAPVVILPIDSTQRQMLDKTAIYTAATRAMQKLILIGQPELFNERIKQTYDLKRISQIKDKLQQLSLP